MRVGIGLDSLDCDYPTLMHLTSAHCTIQTLHVTGQRRAVVGERPSIGGNWLSRGRRCTQFAARGPLSSWLWGKRSSV